MPAFISDLDSEIERCAQYLREKQAQQGREQTTEKPFYDHSSLLAKLDWAEHDLAAAVAHLQDLHGHFVLGCMEPFSRHEMRVSRSYECATEALSEIRITKREVKIFHTQNTREMALQKSAARLAYSICGVSAPRSVREVSKRIMDKAGLSNPEASTLSKWLLEFRQDDRTVK